MLRIKLKNNKYHSISCILYHRWSILTHFYHATFYLISNKAEAEGKFGWSRDWHLLFNFARFPAILSTESANRLICFWCTSTKRTVWVQNEVEVWDFRSRTRGQYMTTDVCKFVKKMVRTLILVNLKKFCWQELQNTLQAGPYYQLGGTDSDGISEILFNNRINGYNWWTGEIDNFVKIVVDPYFYVRFSCFPLMLVRKTFGLVEDDNYFNPQTKF